MIDYRTILDGSEVIRNCAGSVHFSARCIHFYICISGDYSAKFIKKKLQEYFPVFYTKSQMEKVLFQLLEEWKKQNNQSEE